MCCWSAAIGEPLDLASRLTTADLLERLKADVRASRIKCVALPLTVLQGALDGRGGGAMSSVGEGCRADFPILQRVINGSPLDYLDSAASSQKPRQVIEAVSGYYERSHANVHRSIHTLGEEATELYEGARDAVRAFVGARFREEIVFTRGTTEAINLVAQCVGRTLQPGDEILVTEMEHHSNLIPWQMVVPRSRRALESGAGDRRRLPRHGGVPAGFSRRARSWWPRPTSRMCSEPSIPWPRSSGVPHEAGALVLLDGAQGAPHLALDVAAMGADFYAFSGHKMLGPTGIGVLYGRREVLERLEPAWGGGDDQGGVDRSRPVERSALAL